jgi:hypothetical protein
MFKRALRFAIVVGSVGMFSCRTDPIRLVKGDAATVLAEAGKPGPVNELPIPKDRVLKVLNPTNLPEYNGATGVIEGTVVVTGDPAPPLMGKNFDKCPAAAAMYSKTFREGAPLPDGSRPLADAVLGVTGYTEYVVSEKKPAELVTIANCAYDRRSVAMTFGQVLEVKNDHAGPMYAPDLENQSSPAIMMATPGGDPVRIYPKQPGRYRMIDRVGNTWLEADVFVSVTPLHTVSDVSGHYRIEGVPVGKLKIHAWHPAIDHSLEKDVEVKDGVVTTVDFSIPNDKPAERPAPHNTTQILP